jgi:hypothetical protein
MALWKQLVVGASGAALASVLLAAGYQVIGAIATTTEVAGANVDQMARIHAEEVADAKHDSLRLALVLIPLTLAVVWWRTKRAAAPKAT